MTEERLRVDAVMLFDRVAYERMFVPSGPHK